MSSGSAEEEVYTVPSADPLNAYSDPRAHRPWSLEADGIKIPKSRSFLLNCMSMIAMTGATTLGRIVMAFHRVEVHNLEGYKALVAARGENRPLITVSNHQATLDDPLMYSILTGKVGTKWPTKQRWTIGASELCFAGPIIGLFCRLCKVLPVTRGQGIWHPFMDDAVGAISAPTDNWIHLFPEGRVHQDPQGKLLRFKWGVGRLVADPDVTPLVVPIHIEGTRHILSETRPNRMIPSSLYGTKVSIRIGDPIDFTDFVLQAKTQAIQDGPGKVDRVRTYQAITEIIQQSVEKLRGQNYL